MFKNIYICIPHCHIVCNPRKQSAISKRIIHNYNDILHTSLLLYCTISILFAYDLVALYSLCENNPNLTIAMIFAYGTCTTEISMRFPINNFNCISDIEISNLYVY